MVLSSTLQGLFNRVGFVVSGVQEIVSIKHRPKWKEDPYQKYNREMAMEMVINPQRKRQEERLKELEGTEIDETPGRREAQQEFADNYIEGIDDEKKFIEEHTVPGWMCDADGYFYEMDKYYQDRIAVNESAITSMKKLMIDNADSESMTVQAMVAATSEIEKLERFIKADNKRIREWKGELNVLRAVSQFRNQNTGE